MNPKYMILNYTTSTIVRRLSEAEVCAILKALMVMPNPSFDIVDSGRQEFVTQDFKEKSGQWSYSQEPRAMEAK